MKWRILLFLLVFVGIILLSNLYVWWRLTPLGLNGLGAILLIALAIGAFLMGALDRLVARHGTRFLYLAGMVWWGFLFFLFSALLLLEPARLLFEAASVTIAAIIAALALTVMALANGQHLTTREYLLPIAGLREEVRVAHLSDIHLGSVRREGWAAKIAEAVNATRPDLVAITGDLFDGSRLVHEETLAPFKRITAPVFLSVGNHEVYDGVGKIARVLKKTGIRLLRNEVVDHGPLQVAAIDQPAREMRRDNPKAGKLPLRKGKPAILLYHPPSGAEDAAAAGFALQLSGHTHNGQVYPFNLLVKPFFPRLNGLYEVAGMFLHTSPGTGTWGPPMRLGSRNQVTLLRLVPQRGNQ